jgi:hypothetical protein
MCHWILQQSLLVGPGIGSLQPCVFVRRLRQLSLLREEQVNGVAHGQGHYQHHHLVRREDFDSLDLKCQLFT